MLNRDYFEKRLLWSTKLRNYVTTPCIIISGILTLHAVYINNPVLAKLNLFFTTYNVLVYAFSVWMCSKYEQVIESLKKLDTKPVETETSNM